MNLANVLLNYGRTDDALPLVERAVAILERGLGPAHPRTAFAIMILGTVHQQRGTWKRAVELFERAAAIQSSAGEITPLDETMIKLAAAYIALEDFAKARAAIDRAVKIASATNDLFQLAKATTALGRLELAQELPEAEKTLDKALDLFARSVGKDHLEYRRLLMQLQIHFPDTHPDPDSPFQRRP